MRPYVMPDVHTHEIVIRGRLGRRLLGPFLDDFAIDHSDPDPGHSDPGHLDACTTRLVGRVRDAAHLHGLVAYLASINAELISITPINPVISTTTTRSTS